MTDNRRSVVLIAGDGRPFLTTLDAVQRLVHDTRPQVLIDTSITWEIRASYPTFDEEPCFLPTPIQDRRHPRSPHQWWPDRRGSR